MHESTEAKAWVGSTWQRSGKQQTCHQTEAKLETTRRMTDTSEIIVKDRENRIDKSKENKVEMKKTLRKVWENLKYRGQVKESQHK